MDTGLLVVLGDWLPASRQPSACPCSVPGRYPTGTPGLAPWADVRWLSSRPARTVDLKAELNDPAASLAREADAQITAPVLNPMGAGKAGADYPAAVVRTLVGDFPSLANSLTAELVRAAVERQHRQPEPTFECIVDHPTLSTWKLVLRRDEPHAFVFT